MEASLLWLLPAVPALTALTVLAVRSPRRLAVIDLMASLAVFLLALRLGWSVVQHGPVRSGLLGADAVSVVFVLLVGLLVAAVSVYTLGWMPRELAHRGIRESRLRLYYALVHGFVATMLLTVLSDNLGLLWIAMEGTTITSAVLVGFHGHRYGLEAAWKYIIVTTIGISFGLFGTILVYAAAAHAQGGALRALSYQAIAAVASQLDPGIVRIGFIFVLIGYGTKVGLAPMHMWLPDAHSQAPSPVSALLSGALIKCALFGIIRFHTIARGACGPEPSGTLLLAFGLVSVVVATPFILAQRDFKRLLGYHSVEHVGIVALGLGFGGPVGTYAALLHVVNHGVTKALVFFVAGDTISRYRTRNMHAIRGLIGIAPFAGTMLLCGAFSLAGVPPFSIFVSELLVVRAGLGGGHYLAVGVFLLMVAVIFAGLVHHAGAMAFGAAPAGADRSPSRLSPLVGMALLGAVMLLLGVFIPPGLDGLLRRATEIVLG
ncbi:MAG TPA: hydrogenase 4 subunit F [Vicinamibacteria bacterium]|nr:hydrogenase 4 subunit F [Vicinamibacteria bacterium]